MSDALRPKRKALLCGIAQYGGRRWGALPAVKDELTDLATKLQHGLHPHYQYEEVEVLPDDKVTAEAIGAKLREAGGPGHVDEFFFYLAGHGYLHDGFAYFVTYGAERSIPGKRLDEIAGLLTKVSANKVFAVLDFCHAGALPEGLAPLDHLPVTDHKLAVFAATRGNELAEPGGPLTFTRCFLRALDHALPNEQGEVCWGQVVIHVEAAMVRSQRQRPIDRTAGHRTHPLNRVVLPSPETVSAPVRPRGLKGAIPAGGADFTGRTIELQAIDRALRGEGRAVALGGGGALVARGDGGIGKTRLAAEYARRHLQDYPGGVFFLAAQTRSPMDLWAEIGRHLGSAHEHVEDLAAYALEQLAGDARSPALVVLDDVAITPDAPADRFVMPMRVHGRDLPPLPEAPWLRVLVTTRQRDLPGFRELPVEGLGVDDALALLLQRSGRRGLPASEEAAARALVVDDLGGHPLGISIAGAYLRKVTRTIAEFRGRLRAEGVTTVLEAAAERAGISIPDHERLIVATYELSRAQLDPADPIDALAWEVLAVAAQFAVNVGIDRPLLDRCVARVAPTSERDDRDLALDRLLELSLLSPEAGPGGPTAGVRVHALVSDYTRWKLAEPVGGPGVRHIEAVLAGLDALFPRDANEYWRILGATAAGDWELLTAERALHAEAAVTRPRAPTLSAAFLAVSVGGVYGYRGVLGAALPFYRKAQEVCEALLRTAPGTTEVKRLLSVSHDRIGDVLGAQGDQAGALAAYRAGLTIFQRLAAQDPSNATAQRDLSVSHNKVGDVVGAQGDQAGALAAYRAGLTLRERLAAQDPSNATAQRDLSVSHNKVGDVVGAQGDQAGALAAYRAGLTIFQRLAAQDPSNATAQRDLSVSHERIGDVLDAQGDQAGALAAYRAGLTLRERLATQDPSNATAQRDLSISHERIGDVLGDQGDLAGALAAYRAGLTLRERLATQDPSNATAQRDLSVSHNNVGDVLRAQGDRAGALAAYRADLTIAERLAAQDPSNATAQRDLSVSHNKVGDVLRAQGDQAGALAAYRAGLTIAERLAAQDPSNATAQTDLVFSLTKVSSALPPDAMEARTEAKSLLDRALAILRGLAGEGRLTANQRGWMPLVESQLAALA